MHHTQKLLEAPRIVNRLIEMKIDHVMDTANQRLEYTLARRTWIMIGEAV